MTEIRKVASTIEMVWSLEKQEYIPTIGSGDVLLNVERIAPRLFEEGVLVLVDGPTKAASKKPPKPAPQEE